MKKKMVEVMGFTYMDVMAVLDGSGHEVSDQEANEFLEKYGEDFRDRVTEEGYDILDALLSKWLRGRYE
jgi:hypothetical protein